MDKSQTISRRAALIGTAVSTAAMAVPVAAAVTIEDTPFVRPVQPRPATITDVWEQWQKAGDGTEASHARYAELQAKITAMRPLSVRELAMQIIAETDDGHSDWRPEFFQCLRHIAMGV